MTCWLLATVLYPLFAFAVLALVHGSRRQAERERSPR